MKTLQSSSDLQKSFFSVSIYFFSLEWSTTSHCGSHSSWVQLKKSACRGEQRSGVAQITALTSASSHCWTKINFLFLLQNNRERLHLRVSPNFLYFLNLHFQYFHPQMVFQCSLLKQNLVTWKFTSLKINLIFVNTCFASMPWSLL